MINLLCLFFGHEIPFWTADDDYVCRECGKDTKPSWLIQLESEERLEALYLACRDREKKAAS